MGLVAYMTWSQRRLGISPLYFAAFLTSHIWRAVQKTSGFCEKAHERKQPAFKQAEKPNVWRIVVFSFKA